MAKLPNVYYITIKNGYGVIKNPNGSYEFDVLGDATLFLEDEIDNELEVVRHFFDKNAKIMDADQDYVRSIATNYFRGIDKIGDHDQLYPPRLVSRLVDCLKDEKESLIRLSEALKPTSSHLKKEEDITMSEEKKNIYVRFHKNFKSNRPIFKKVGESTIKLAGIKLPNDDLNDKSDMRQFVVKETMIQTDEKNPNYRYVYLNPDVEYTVKRVHFNPDTKETTYSDETKMTAQQLADIHKAERDRRYALALENSENKKDSEAVAQASPEVVKDDEGIGME